MQINWSIENMERRSKDGFVNCVYWRATALDNGHANSVHGTVGLDGNEPSIPFDELTKETVLEWVFDKIDKEDVESNLTKNIADQKDPPQKSGVPW